MSHPPETGLTSREIIKRLRKYWRGAGTSHLLTDEQAIALIEAWVQKKIAEALEAAVNG